jgi:putative DNA primase/helicase
MGITGWPEGEAMRAAGYCFKAWLSARGTTDDSENGNAIDQVRTFLEVHGASRFSFMNEEDNGGEDYRIVNRAGYKRKTADGEIEYLIFRTVFRTEVCKGFDHTKVEDLLIQRNFLAVDRNGKRQIVAKRAAGYHDESGNLVTDEKGKLKIMERFYCVRPAIFIES